MGSRHPGRKIFLWLLCICSFRHCYSWGWFSSGPSKHQTLSGSSIVNAEFSMNNLNDPRGVESVERAKSRLASSNSCWQDAYQSLFSSCSEILANKDKQSRLAWHLSDCFQKDSGRPGFSHCGSSSPMANCLKSLDEFQHNIYLQFFLETNAICHQLQSEAFKLKTEKLINDLKSSAINAEEKLETIEEKSDLVLQNAERLHGSLASIDTQTEELAQTSRVVEHHLGEVWDKSKAVFEQASAIASSQSLIQETQHEMKEKLASSMAILGESYQSLDQGIVKLQNDAMEIERGIQQIGESMFRQMKSLQDKANDIEDVAAVSLDKQKQLLHGQSEALQGLDFIGKFLSTALEESRSTLQQLAEFGEKQQLELIRRQEKLHETHDHLTQNSISILAAQEAFEKKQATMFVALEKLFTLHNAILLESRAIKSFFFYLGMVFVIYMMTSAKQTFGARARLYLGLCIVSAVEISLIRAGSYYDLDQQSWISSRVFLVRLTFLLAGMIQLLYSVYSFRDYEYLNHTMLLTVIEKLKAMEENEDGTLSLGTGDDDGLLSLMDSGWLVEEDICKDPDFHLREEVGENSLTTSSHRIYNFRPRKSRIQRCI